MTTLEVFNDLLDSTIEDVSYSALCGSVGSPTSEVTDHRHGHRHVVVPVRVGAHPVPHATLVGTPVLAYEPVVGDIRPTWRTRDIRLEMMMMMMMMMIKRLLMMLLMIMLMQLLLMM